MPYVRMNNTGTKTMPQNFSSIYSTRKENKRETAVNVPEITNAIDFGEFAFIGTNNIIIASNYNNSLITN